MAGRPGSSSLVAGVACLVLAGFVFMLPVPAAFALPFAVVAGAGGLAGLWTGWRRQKAARYDLRRLSDPPPDPPEEPYLDAIPEGEVSAPYCGWCDECYPPGTYRCRECGRELG